jgi:hypothetical protein
MGRKKHKLAIVGMLTCITVLTSVYRMTGSSPVPGPTPLSNSATNVSTNDQADISTLSLVSQSSIHQSRVSLSLSDDLSTSTARLDKVRETQRSGDRPNVRVWYGQYFKEQNLKMLSASPIEREPNRLGLKISFSF